MLRGASGLGKIGTWLECDHARTVKKKEVLAFLVASDYDWPAAREHKKGCPAQFFNL